MLSVSAINLSLDGKLRMGYLLLLAILLDLDRGLFVVIVRAVVTRAKIIQSTLRVSIGSKVNEHLLLLFELLRDLLESCCHLVFIRLEGLFLVFLEILIAIRFIRSYRGLVVLRGDLRKPLDFVVAILQHALACVQLVASNHTSHTIGELTFGF
jgi:hypothetical protein